MRARPAKEISGVFLSYFEGSKKSTVIVEQMKEFFEEWGLPCHVISRVEGTEPPRPTMIERLSKSQFLLQLFTDHRNVRKWMQWEWDMAQGLWQASGTVMRQPVILHTNETNLKNKSFRQLRSDVDGGTIKITNLDDEAQVRTFLSGLLIETGRLHTPHGPIQLPPFCQPPVAAERITLEIVEEYIRNFKQATMKGLEMVLADRKELEPRLKERLKQLERERGFIRMTGITLNKSVLSKQRNDVGHAFKSAIDNGARAQLLLLDLTCEAARERAKIETPDCPYQKSLLYRESREVSDLYANSPRVEIRPYRAPYAGLIIFEDEAYVEIYHLGKQIRDRDICGRVPILVVKRRSEPALFELFDQHFTSVWGRPDKTGISRVTRVVQPKRRQVGRSL